MPFNVNNTTVVTDDRIVQSVSGAVGSRPGTPVTGMMFFNTTNSIMEVYNGTTWVSTTVGGGGTPNAWSFGSSGLGTLGDNSVVNKSSPVSVVGGYTDWVSMSAGVFFSLGIRANGTLWAWGSNSTGQLGDGSATTASKSSPVAVVGGFTNWVSTSASIGNPTSLGVRADGTLWAWGSNLYGQLGDGSATTASKSSPVAVVGGFADWILTSSGNAHSVGLRANGTLWAWGDNGYGVLGNNSAVDRSSPVSVVGGILDWVGVSSGSSHNVGIRANGTLYAWGYNGDGSVGDGTVVARSSPVLVTGGIVNWINATTGTNHCLGLRGTGQLYAWGRNADGQLGDGTVVARSSPVIVVGGFTNWTSSISSGFASNVGIRADGTLWTWGSNANGQLGDGSVVNRSSPVSVIGGFTNWASIESGNFHVIGIRT